MTLRHFRSNLRAAALQNVVAHVDARDLGTEYTYAAIRAIAASPGLRIVGLSCALPPHASEDDVRAAVHESVMVMERLHADCEIVLTQLVLEDPGDDLGVRPVPLQHRHDLLDALDAACARARFPRPGLLLVADVETRAGSRARVQ